MDKIKCTKRWIEVHQTEAEIEVREGFKVEYYGDSGKFLQGPKEGIIKKNDKGNFYIEWEDTESLTQIDGSEQSLHVLKMCAPGANH